MFLLFQIVKYQSNVMELSHNVYYGQISYIGLTHPSLTRMLTHNQCRWGFRQSPACHSPYAFPPLRFHQDTLWRFPKAQRWRPRRHRLCRHWYSNSSYRQCRRNSQLVHSEIQYRQEGRNVSFAWS